MSKKELNKAMESLKEAIALEKKGKTLVAQTRKHLHMLLKNNEIEKYKLDDMNVTFRKEGTKKAFDTKRVNALIEKYNKLEKEDEPIILVDDEFENIVVVQEIESYINFKRDYTKESEVKEGLVITFDKKEEGK